MKPSHVLHIQYIINRHIAETGRDIRKASTRDAKTVFKKELQYAQAALRALESEFSDILGK